MLGSSYDLTSFSIAPSECTRQLYYAKVRQSLVATVTNLLHEAPECAGDGSVYVQT